VQKFEKFFAQTELFLLRKIRKIYCKKYLGCGELGSFFKKFSSAFENGVVFDLWWL
jgi:hypothetical protein